MGERTAYGLVLAAGAGRRFGGPKVLARAGDGTPWLRSVCDALREGGCGTILVTLAPGMEAAASGAAVPEGDVVPVLVADAHEGIAASVRAGLAAAACTDAHTVVVCPVDVPGLPAAAVARVLAAAGSALDGSAPDGSMPDDAAPDALVQARYDGRPGHPVAIGRAHWAALRAELAGDVGAGPYLRRHGATRVECGDLWSGADIDSPDAVS